MWVPLTYKQKASHVWLFIGDQTINTFLNFSKMVKRNTNQVCDSSLKISREEESKRKKKSQETWRRKGGMGICMPLTVTFPVFLRFLHLRLLTRNDSKLSSRVVIVLPIFKKQKTGKRTNMINVFVIFQQPAKMALQLLQGVDTKLFCYRIMLKNNCKHVLLN